jgi:hypothetical protein
LLDDLSYSSGTDVIPPEPKEEHEHYLACVNCEKIHMDECLKLTAEAEQIMSQVEEMIDIPYCGHMKYDLAHMLLNPKIDNEKVKKLIEKTKRLQKRRTSKAVSIECIILLWRGHLKNNLNFGDIL